MSMADMANRRRAALHTLDRLVGTWAIDGASTGTVRYSWFEGEAFLVQTIDLVDADRQATRGVEYIRWDPESQTLRSHYFGGAGEVLEYTYEIADDTWTIWFGGIESPAKFIGTFDETGDRCVGAWQWPGGGYESNMTRTDKDADA